MSRRWTVSLVAAAEADFRQILRWTVEQFGSAQARAYSNILLAALQELSEGPDIVGARKRDDIAEGLYTLHVARKGRKGRHFVLFRIRNSVGQDHIEVLRLLHDAMDLQRHLGEEEDGE